VVETHKNIKKTLWYLGNFLLNLIDYRVKTIQRIVFCIQKIVYYSQNKVFCGNIYQYLGQRIKISPKLDIKHLEIIILKSIYNPIK
jgi:hypothetical protein